MNILDKLAVITILAAALIGLQGCTAEKDIRAETNRKAAPSPTPAKTREITELPTERTLNDLPYEEEEPKTVRTERPPAKVSGGKITKANYDKIETGMTLPEVEKILGGEGLKVGTNIVNGRTTEIYKWTEDDFKSYIDIIIEKEKVVEKREKGLS